MVNIVDVDATWVNPSAVTYDAGEIRRADSTAFAGSNTDFGALGGIARHADNTLDVSIDGSDEVTILPGAAVIPGNAVAGSGVWRAAIDAPASGTLDARHATNPRIDLVVFRQLDTDVVGTHTDYLARIEVITGTPSATPSAPALPDMAVELARLNVPASSGGSATVDLSNRTYTAALGGELPVQSLAMLPATATIGQVAIALDTLNRYRWNGSLWLPQDTVQHRYLDTHVATPLSGSWGDVTGLSFDAEAGGVYALDVLVFLLNSGSSTPKWKGGWNWSGTGEMSSAQSGLDTGVVAPSYNGTNTQHAILGATSSPLRPSTGLAAPSGVGTVGRVAATFFCTAAGTVQMEHAQFTSDATYATQVRKGSRLRIERLA